jgi:hypothetical protein
MLSGEIRTRTQIHVLDEQFKNFQFNFFTFFDQKVKYFNFKVSIKGFKIKLLLIFPFLDPGPPPSYHPFLQLALDCNV